MTDFVPLLFLAVIGFTFFCFSVEKRKNHQELCQTVLCFLGFLMLRLLFVGLFYTQTPILQNVRRITIFENTAGWTILSEFKEAL
jgi:hypothetical protein